MPQELQQHRSYQHLTPEGYSIKVAACVQLHHWTNTTHPASTTFDSPVASGAADELEAAACQPTAAESDDH